MSFNPDPNLVNNFVEVLRANLNQAPGSSSQVFAQLQKLRSLHEFLNYLAFIFSHEGAPIDVRQMAGLELKNNLKRRLSSLEPPALAHLKGALLPTLASPNTLLRNVACTTLAVILGTGGLQSWPELTFSIVECLETQTSGPALEGCIDLVLKLSEDYPGELDAKLTRPGTSAPTTWSSLVVPPLIKAAALPSLSEHARNEALKVMLVMMHHMPNGYNDNATIERFRDVLFTLALQNAPGVKVQVISALIRMLEQSSWALEPSLLPLSQFMLQACQSDESTPDGDVSMFAAEWWSAYATTEMDPALIRDLLPSVVQVLLRNMVYEEGDEEVTRAEAEEKLRWNEKKGGLVYTAGGGGGGGGSLSGFAGGVELQYLEGENADAAGAEEVEPEEADAYGEGEGAYTVRKSSARALDLLTGRLGVELLNLVWPVVEQRIVSGKWEERESAVLALGAMANGNAQLFLERGIAIADSLVAHLSKDPNPLVRTIACWTLSKVAVAVLQIYYSTGGSPEAARCLEGVLNVILERVMDHNSCVRQGATAALEIVVEDDAGARDEHTPQGQQPAPPLISGARLAAVVRVISMAAEQYPKRDLSALQSALEKVAEVCGPVLIQEGPLCRQLLEPVVQRLLHFPPLDPLLCTQMDMLSTVVRNVKHRFDFAVAQVFRRCIEIATLQLNARDGTFPPDSPAFEFDEGFVVSSFDLISNMCEGLGASLEPLVSQTPLLYQLVMHACRPQNYETACEGESPELQRAGFGLAGDLVRTLRQATMPHVANLIQLALQRTEPTSYNGYASSAYSNALWMMSEMAGVYGGAPFEDVNVLSAIVMRCFTCLSYHAMLDSLTVENATILMGKLCLAQPDKMAVNLANYFLLFTMGLRKLISNDDKRASFEGLLAVLERNAGVLQDLDRVRYLLLACSSWVRLPESLRGRLAPLLARIKADLVQAGQWATVVQPMGEAPLNKLVKLGLLASVM